MSVVQLKWVRVPVPVVGPPVLNGRGSILRAIHVRLRRLRRWLYRRPRPERLDVGEQLLARI